MLITGMPGPDGGPLNPFSIITPATLAATYNAYRNWRGGGDGDYSGYYDTAKDFYKAVVPYFGGSSRAVARTTGLGWSKMKGGRMSGYRGGGGKKKKGKKPVSKKLKSSALANTRTSKPHLCKGIGTYFPNCMAVSFSINISDRYATTAGSYYDIGLRMYPLNPATASARITGAQAFGNAGASTAALVAFGFDQIVGTASPQMYKSCLCYKVKYRVAIHPIGVVNTAAGSVASGEHIGGWTHMIHPVSNGDAVLTAPTTADILDRNVVQPEVKSVHKAPWTAVVNAGAANSTPFSFKV